MDRLRANKAKLEAPLNDPRSLQNRYRIDPAKFGRAGIMLGVTRLE
jgi:hypothetical protein